VAIQEPDTTATEWHHSSHKWYRGASLTSIVMALLPVPFKRRKEKKNGSEHLVQAKETPRSEGRSVYRLDIIPQFVASIQSSRVVQGIASETLRGGLKLAKEVRSGYCRLPLGITLDNCTSYAPSFDHGSFMLLNSFLLISSYVAISHLRKLLPAQSAFKCYFLIRRGSLHTIPVRCSYKSPNVPS